MDTTLPGPGPHWRPRAVVFDCDGVLMDTESAWARVQAQVAESFGVTLDERAGTSLMGLSAADVARDISRRAATVAEQRDEPAPGFDAVYERLVRTEEDVVGEVLEPLPGAIETVRACAQRVPVAVASNSTRGILDRKMHAIGLADVVVTWVSAQDVPRGKPAPDIYEEAARRLGVEPADALAVEDSPAGTAAAVAAGLWVLGVPHGHDEPITSHFRAESLADPAVGDMLRVWGLPL
ncbi:HAD family phosphatase [Kocuria marina subsp. indica]|uniref:HAD family hydrolase n=1 Tax=Kocuria TaxID=57493 RepID=UPI00103D5341|nr:MULTISPECIES: HAD family phosphatase [Kocuria]MDT0119687.1 HAD family phosphatase [Kocuria sp. PD6]QBJ20710.1 HAD family phosphatase [Kocuria indica]